MALAAGATFYQGVAVQRASAAAQAIDADVSARRAEISRLQAKKEAAVTRLATVEREIDSRRLGEMVMEELRKLDKVAYIRFASVYRSFSDVDDFRDAIREVREK